MMKGTRGMWGRTACVAAGFAAAVLATAPARAQTRADGATPLPAFEFRLRCHDDSAEQTDAEIGGIQALHEFAREHDAEVVWLDAIITADAGAGACSRDVSEFPDQPMPTGERARIHIQPCVEEERADVCSHLGWTVQIVANGPPLAYTHAVYLQPQASLEKGLPYRFGGYGDWLNYQGPFIVRFFEGTGYAYVTFDAPDPALPGVWERARCNARPARCAP
ncbi:hypothetical protein [Brevundimonas sp. FT23042]|uniref:hypothetical protein n=1 Tax=Brevundimonas sp. FT23042 TaxID=3393749 RepID=UPI003B58821E